MSIEQRKHMRFSLAIPAIISTKYGERQDTVLQQISIGGCFTGWEENIFTGDEFRMEIGLPNGNRIPLACRAVYRFENTGLGVQFTDITLFEQSLVAAVIKEKLNSEGLPTNIDPFAQPAEIDVSRLAALDKKRLEKEARLEQVMSGEG